MVGTLPDGIGALTKLTYVNIALSPQYLVRYSCYWCYSLCTFRMFIIPQDIWRGGKRAHGDCPSDDRPTRELAVR